MLHRILLKYRWQQQVIVALNFCLIPLFRLTSLRQTTYYLFPLLENSFREKVFEDDSAVIDAVESFLNEQDTDFYSIGLLKLEHR